MGINYQDPSQFEFFPRKPENHVNIETKGSLPNGLTFPIENFVVVGIVSVMILVVFFFLGVERGKRIACVQEQEEKINYVKIMENKTAEEAIEVVQEDEAALVADVDSGEDIKQDTVEEKERMKIFPVKEIEIRENIFTVQVASFKLEKNARREALKLKDIGRDTFIQAKGDYSIVCVGKFEQKKEAKNFSNRLKKRYNDCLVRRL